MSKHLRREAARSCPIHQTIMETAADQLSLHGVFEKDAILDQLNLKAMSDAIRWDYIRDFLQQEQKCELVPLASVYFKRHQMHDEIANPSRYIAGGHGKKTAGYAAITSNNDHLVVAKIKIKHAISNGVGEAFRNYLQAAEDKRVGSGLTPLQISVDKAS
ncbi:MAG: hypothetical protein ACPGZR_09310 [Paracoccaceae bacterium]